MHVTMEAARVYSKPLWHVPKALHAGPEVRAHVHCFGEAAKGFLRMPGFGPYGQCHADRPAGGVLGRMSPHCAGADTRAGGVQGASGSGYPGSVNSLIEDGIEPFLVALSSTAALASARNRGRRPNQRAAAHRPRRVPGASQLLAARRLRAHRGQARRFCTRAPHGSHLAAAFSGGGDSFVTLFGHTARREPALAPAPQGHGVRALRPRLRHPAGGRGNLPSPRRSAPVVGRLRCRPRRRRVLALG